MSDKKTSEFAQNPVDKTMAHILHMCASDVAKSNALLQCSLVVVVS